MVSKMILTDDFVKKVTEEVTPPFTELGEFVLYRTYSRYLYDKKRRESWSEICKRSVEYNVSLQKLGKECTDESLRSEAETLFKNMYGLKQFLSGRTLWSGGTSNVDKHPICNFNCAFTIIDDYDSISELFYLLMIGTGVGIRLLKTDVEKLNPIRSNFHVSYKYEPVSKEYRQDNTSLVFSNGSRVSIVIGDSKEGWIQGLKNFFNILTDNFYKSVTHIEFDFSNVRPKGERIKGFGGTASGHESLKRMFEKISKVIKGTLCDDYPKIINNVLRPIHVLDICNIIGENVVSGGVRRTSEIALISADDDECINAKKGISEVPSLYHRFMSNNSIFYTKRPTRRQLREQFKLIRKSGEPCFINAETASKRRKNFNGVNPCGEVLLDDKGLCNLTTINVTAFVKNGDLDLDELLLAQKLSVRSGVRMTLLDLELPEWNKVQKRDRLVGCSLTGWQDMVGMTNMSMSEQRKVLVSLRRVAEDEASRYAEFLGIDKPLLVTTVKPEGTISQLPTVSSGVHFTHSKFYIRRVRISRSDALCKVAEKLGWVIKPEVGQRLEDATTMVIEFPVKSESNVTKFDVGALDQLEIYKTFQKYYTQHNSSNTISVRNGEWGTCADWVYDNWSSVIGVTFLPLDEKTYELAPYESITEEEYEKRKSVMKSFDFDLLCEEERLKDEYVPTEIIDKACESGACPLR